MIKIGCWKFILCKYTEKISTLGYKLMKNFFNMPAGREPANSGPAQVSLCLPERLR